MIEWKCNNFVIFILLTDEARENGCGILVHCLAGISRSVTVTVAYLMQKEQMTLNQAYDHVKRCKPNISPNFNFMGQLLDFEKALSGNDTQGHPGFFCQRSNPLDSDTSVRQTWRAATVDLKMFTFHTRDISFFISQTKKKTKLSSTAWENCSTGSRRQHV